MASPEPSAAAAGAGGDAASQRAAVEPFRLPTPEEFKGQEMMNNCAVRSVLSGVMAECVVEKARAKHDITNSAVAGCVTGGALAAKGGPQATCIGCVGFGAFSVAIEKFMERHT